MLSYRSLSWILLYVAIFSSAIALEEKRICVVIPSYNNSTWVEKNLISVFSQQYTNYSVIYIDDSSLDDTHERAVDIVKKYGQQNRVHIIHNRCRVGALANLYNAIHACHDDTIIVHLDGDDWLPHNNVLAEINDVYTEHDIWFTYGQYTFSDNLDSKGHPRAYPDSVIYQNTFRRHGWFMSHLRTHYAWLFKHIKLEDLLLCGQFYMTACDVAILYPMVEMASRGHFKFIDKILYVYNRGNILSDYKGDGALEQELICDCILAKEPYIPLDRKISLDIGANKADLFIISSAPIDKFIQDINTQECAAHCIGSLYHISFDKKNSIKKYKFHKTGKLYPGKGIHDNIDSNLIHEILKTSKSEFALFLTNLPSQKFLQALDYAMRSLREHHAQVFLGDMNQAIGNNDISMTLIPISLDSTMFAWQPQKEIKNWIIPTIDNAIWKKDFLVKNMTLKCTSTADSLRKCLHEIFCKKQALAIMPGSFDSQVVEKPAVVVIKDTPEAQADLIAKINKMLVAADVLLVLDTYEKRIIKIHHKKIVESLSYNGSLSHALLMCLDAIKSSLVFLTTDDTFFGPPLDTEKITKIFLRSKADVCFSRLYDEGRRLHAIKSKRLSNLDQHAYLWQQRKNLVGSSHLPVINMTLWKKGDLYKVFTQKSVISVPELCKELHACCCLEEKLCLDYQDLKYDMVGKPEIMVFARPSADVKKIYKKLKHSFQHVSIFHIVQHTDEHASIESFSTSYGSPTRIDYVESEDCIGNLMKSVLKKTQAGYIVCIDAKKIKNIPLYVKNYVLKLMQAHKASVVYFGASQDYVQLFDEKMYCICSDIVKIDKKDLPFVSDGSIWYRTDLINALHSRSLCSMHSIDSACSKYVANNDLSVYSWHITY